MFEFEDELIIIDSYRIPWLIWIQLLAMFLLVIIIYYFTTESDDHNQFTASPSVGGVSFANPSIISSGGGDAKVRENEITETGTSTGEVVQRARKSNARQSEGSSTMDDGNMIFEHSHHPCNFLGLAKQAFLKCLGIDSTPESSTRKQHEKTD